MNSWPFVISGAIALLTVSEARAASFACSSARTFIEHAICDNPDLSRKDDTLSALYSRLRQGDPAVVASQRAWLARRDLCQTVSCVRDAYDQRLSQLGGAHPDAESSSPIGHYSKRRGGNGELLVEANGAVWTLRVDAGGIPRGAATAADCPLVAIGQLNGVKFSGEIKYTDYDYLTNGKWTAHPSVEDKVDPGHPISVTFKPGAALVETDASDICGAGEGVSGLYVKTTK